MLNAERRTQNAERALALSILFLLAICQTSWAITPPPDRYPDGDQGPTRWRKNVGQMRKTDGTGCDGIKYTSEASPVGIHLSEKSLVSFTMSRMHRDSTESDSLYLVNMTFPGSNERDPLPLFPTPDLANYYLGSFEAEDVPAFHRVVYESLYDSINLHYHHGSTGPRMTFEVLPGGDPYAIYMAFEGQDSLNVDWAGNLKIYLEGKWIELQEAVAFQLDGNGDVVPVNWTAEYEHTNSNAFVKFNFDTYDTTAPLILQIGYPPLFMGGGSGTRNLEWSTYMGGPDGGDELTSVQVDEVGNPYMCGYTWSYSFPVDPGTNVFPPFVGNPPGSLNAVLMKFQASNKRLIWATYYGGNTMTVAQKIAVYKGVENDHQYVFATGSTTSSDFYPYRELNTIFDQAEYESMGTAVGKMWIGAFQKYDGHRHWATTHGQTNEENGWTEHGMAIDVNEAGTLAVGGFIQNLTNTYPTIPAVDPGGSAYVRSDGDGFLTSFNSAYQIEWHTGILDHSFEARSRIEDIQLVKHDGVTFLWFTGATGSIDGPYDLPDYLVNTEPFPDPFPIPGPDPNGTSYFQYFSNAYTNAVIGCINLTEHNIAYCTVWSSPSFEDLHLSAGHAILETPEGVWVVGTTTGLGFTNSELPAPPAGQGTVLHNLDVDPNVMYTRSDAFIIRYKPGTFKLDYGTLLGGTRNDIMLDVASDGNGTVYFTGETRSAEGFTQDLDPFKYYQPHHNIANRRDAILLALEDNGRPTVQWSSIFGGTESERGRGIAASESEVFLVGATSSQFTEEFPLHEFDENDELDFYQAFNLLGGSWISYQFPPWESFSRTLDYERFFYDEEPPIEPYETQYDGFIASFGTTESPVGIEQIPGSNSDEAVMLVWQVPGETFWTVRTPYLAKWDLELFDASGRYLRKTKNYSQQFEIDLNDLASGIYILVATDESGSRYSTKLPKR